ncbi:MAG: glycosyltransferase family 4 protein [Rhodospirillales bacterium]|nr:glycosyltransferase family 4 protein [Rhodospirillales bacterium]
MTAKHSLDRSLPRLWYAGARGGDAGGPALKLRKLQAAFPQCAYGYNLVYMLSAASYLSKASLERLRSRHIPSVLNQNGVYYRAWYEGDWQARNQTMATAHRHADHVLYQSEFCQRASARFLGERLGTSEILYNAVDTAAFAPGPAQPFSGPLLVLVTGKIDAHQIYRLEQAVEGIATARRQGLECGLVAAGIFAPEAIVAAIKAAERNAIEHAVMLMGPFSQAQAPELYRQAHIYLTLTHQDACPSAVIEAMASGLSVVYPASGGTPELVGEAGIALPSCEDWEKPQVPSADAIGEAIGQAAARRDVLSAMARERAVRLFSIKDWLARHAALFRELLVSHD